VQILADPPGNISSPGAITFNGCATQIDLSWGAATLPGGSCNSIVGYRIQRATDPDTTFFAPTTFTSVTLTYVDTAVTSNSLYWYRVWALDNLGRIGPAGSAVLVKADPANVCGPPPAPSPTSTFTLTPVPTAVPVPGKAQVYPNPFHPDRGECFRIGNVPANTSMKIYDMVGALVYSRTIPGNSTACVDNWDGFNNNGQKVVTGLYQVLLTFPDGTNTIYRVAVIRGT
jgi:hypothetical protein